MEFSWIGLGLLADKFRDYVGRPRNSEKEQTHVEWGKISPALSWMRSKANGQWELLSTDELIKKNGFKTYREMLSDETVKACLAFKKVLIHQRDWDISFDDKEGGDINEEQKKYADFVKDNLRNIGFNAVLRAMLTAFEYGYSVGEIIYEVKPDDEGQLKIFIKEIKHRDPEFVKILVDPHGNIIKYIQTPGMIQEIEIDPSKIIHYAYQGEFSNHYGISDLRAAYRSWWSKKFIQQFWNIFLERFGQPLMKMTYPTGASPELLTNLRAIIESLSSRSDMLLPQGVEVELIEATRAGTAAYGEALMYSDVAISRAILVPALLGMGVDIKRGSDSQSRLHLRVLMKIVGDVSQDLEAIITKKLVEPIIKMNFPDVKECPRFVFRDYGEYEATEIVDSAINMFNAGMLDADQADINYLRSVLALPMRDSDNPDEVMRAPPPPAGTSPNDPNATGDGAGKNNNRATKGPAQKVKSGS